MDTKKLNHNWILFAVILASGMAFLDGTIVNIAIPVIQEEFSAGIDRIQWVLNAFMLLLASLLPLSGALSDKFGRKRIFNLGIIVFIASSAAAGFSQSVLQMIIWRAIQGAGAAMMVPGSLAVIRSCFPENRRGRAIGLWSGFSGGLAAMGPFLGGWLVESFGWPWVFFVKVPIGIAALLVSFKFIPETKNPNAGRIDLAGAVLILFALFGISFGLIQGPVSGWGSPIVYASLIAGAGLLAAFVAVEKWAANPLFPIRIFKSKLVLGANLATLFLYFALSGLIFMLVLNFQQVQGLSPIRAGLGLLPPIILITFLSGPLGGLSDRIGPRIPLLIGTSLVALGMFWLILPGANAGYMKEFFPGLCLFGLGMAFAIAPITKSALAVPDEFSGSSSGINNAVSRAAGLLAVAVLGAVALTVFTGRLNKSLELSGLPAGQRAQIASQANKFGAIEIPENFSETERHAGRLIIETSFVKGFRTAQIINTAAAAASALIVFVLIKIPEADIRSKRVVVSRESGYNENS